MGNVANYSVIVVGVVLILFGAILTLPCFGLTGVGATCDDSPNIVVLAILGVGIFLVVSRVRRLGRPRTLVLDITI